MGRCWNCYNRTNDLKYLGGHFYCPICYRRIQIDNGLLEIFVSGKTYEIRDILKMHHLDYRGNGDWKTYGKNENVASLINELLVWRSNNSLQSLNVTVTIVDHQKKQKKVVTL